MATAHNDYINLVLHPNSLGKGRLATDIAIL
jgi:hypothetical protein